MKRYAIAALLALGLLSLGLSAVEPAKVVEPEKVLEPEDRRLRKAPETKTYFTNYENGTIVNFDHKTHAQGYGLECISCHHVEACEDCHRQEVRDMQVEEAKVALHKNCLGCHREVEAGPRKCAECHHK